MAHKVLAVLLAGFTVLGLSAIPARAQAQKTFSVDRISVPSGKSFEEVTEAVKSLVAKNGMMIMAQIDQGKMLSMTGLSLKATLFLVGNPNIGKQLFQENHGVGLYVPLRLFVYADEGGKTHVAYDKPSSLLGQFENQKVSMVAQMLDEKIHGLATMAAQ